MKNNDNKQSRWILKNLVSALVFVLGFVLVTSIFLAIYTRHNKETEVPDFTNLTFSQARNVAISAGLRAVQGDSVYVRRLKPGVVFDQLPKAGTRVKPGRKIQLTTNTTRAKQVPMPSLVGYSLRQARAEIQRSSLVLGELIYEEDIATNNVLRQLCEGKEIEPGSMVTSGSTINLVLGLDSSENVTYVPDLYGKNYQQALNLLQDNSLNIGRVRFDSRVKTYADSLSATVYFQSPSSSAGAVGMGTSVSFSLRSVE